MLARSMSLSLLCIVEALLLRDAASFARLIFASRSASFFASRASALRKSREFF